MKNKNEKNKNKYNNSNKNSKYFKSLKQILLDKQSLEKKI